MDRRIYVRPAFGRGRDTRGLYFAGTMPRVVVGGSPRPGLWTGVSLRLTGWLIAAMAVGALAFAAGAMLALVLFAAVVLSHWRS